MTSIDRQIDEGIDTKRTPYAVCPYCGHAHHDSWELEGEDGEECETACGMCEKDFRYFRNVDISYSTLPTLPKEASDE